VKLTRHQLAQIRWKHDPRARARAGFWWTLLWYAVIFVASELLRPKPKLENAKPAGLGDFQFPTATEERFVPLLWGTVQITGPNVVWWGDLIQQAITEKVKTGLFSSSTITKGYRYFVGIQSALCRGTVDQLLTVWIGDDEVISQTDIRSYGVSNPGTGYSRGDKLTLTSGTGTKAVVQVTKVAQSTGAVVSVTRSTRGDYTVLPTSPSATTGGGGSGCTISFEKGPITDGEAFGIYEPNLFGGEDLGSGGVTGRLQFFAGSPTQAVSDYLALHQIIGANDRTPAYRGTCYVCPESEAMYVGTSTSIKPWKYEVQRIPNGLALSGSGKVNTYDANPMNVLYEILTDTDWGLAVDPAMIDTASFTTAAATLVTEGNGFSYIADSPREASELISLIEEQIDGVMFFNNLTAQFQIRLARADYTIGSIPSLDDSNIISFNSFSRGSWEDTTNFMRSEFNDRADNYKGTYGLAIDSANIRTQDGAIIVGTRTYPGVKDKNLANQLAWRDLRSLAVPMAKANLKVNATLYDLQPGQPVKVTNADLGLDETPMRIIRIDYGEMTDNTISLDLVEDIFYYLAPSFGPPDVSSWEPPTDTLDPFDPAETLVFEAPRAFNARDAQSDGPLDHRIWASGRKQGVEITFKAMTKLNAAADSAYAEVAEGVQFLRLGELTSALTTSGTDPITINITCTPDSQTSIREVFEDFPAVATLGTDLSQLIMIGNEFLLVTGAADSGATVNLSTVYRGVLDSTREAHAAGTPVFIISGGGLAGGVSFGPYGQTDQMDVKLRPRSGTDTVATADANEESLTLNRRSRRPYPPGRVSIGGTVWSSTVALEQLGGGAEATGFASTWIRRDYRIADLIANEIDALSTDAGTTYADFPAANTTTYTVRLYNDPAGANTLLLTYSSLSAVSQNQLRIAILKANSGVLPTTLAIEIEASHTDDGDVLAARHILRHIFAVTSALTGQFAFGATAASVASNLYTATVNGTYAFTLSSAFTVGAVQYSLNAAAYVDLITAGNTTGNIAGVVATDTIRVRHNSTDTTVTKQLDMNAPGAGQDGFAILYT